VPHITEDRFRLLVLASLDGLPGWARKALECLDVTVDDEPPEAEPPETMGLFEGVPFPERDEDFDCEPHELSHYFGIDDDQLLDLGAY
jgi:predicted Zn-dependent protease with MMP-like domain